MASNDDRGQDRPQRDEVDDSWALKLLLGLALWPYFFILTASRCLPLSLGGMDKPTHFPSLRILALCWPLTLLQTGLALCFLPVLLWDYRARYLESIGERGSELPQKPKEGVSHGVATWLFTRYIEQPLFKVDTLRPDEAMLQAATGAGGEKGRRYLLRSLPYRAGGRPLIMQARGIGWIYVSREYRGYLWRRINRTGRGRLRCLRATNPHPLTQLFTPPHPTYRASRNAS
jgi:hypothetical protein